MYQRFARLVEVAVTAAILMLLPGARVVAADTATLPVHLGPGSTLWLEGTSTVHDFESRTHAVTLRLTHDPAVAAPVDAPALLGFIRGAKVAEVFMSVAVDSLRSDKAGLDKNLRRAMRSDSFPTVAFRLTHYTVQPAAAEADTVTIDSDGTLTIAGIQHPVTLATRVWRTSAGVWLEGSKVLRMSEYGIKPPKMMLGTLKVRDPITVRYRLLLLPAGEVSGSPAHGHP